MALALAETPTYGGVDLSPELEKLREVTTNLLNGEQVEHDVDGLAKLINAVTKLAEFTLKAEQSISAKELKALVISMGQVVNAHVHDQHIQSKIQRGWVALISEAAR